MVYKIKQPKPKPKKGMITYKSPELGDTKEKIRFAFFPVDITKTEGVWLEKYAELWEYRKYYHTVSKYPYNSTKLDISEKELTKGWKLVGKRIIKK